MGSDKWQIPVQRGAELDSLVPSVLLLTHMCPRIFFPMLLEVRKSELTCFGTARAQFWSSLAILLGCSLGGARASANCCQWAEADINCKLTAAHCGDDFCCSTHWCSVCVSCATAYCYNNGICQQDGTCSGTRKDVNIPAASAWALIVLTFGLLTAGPLAVRRRAASEGR